jgi:hypothetical protein
MRRRLAHLALLVGATLPTALCHSDVLQAQQAPSSQPATAASPPQTQSTPLAFASNTGMVFSPIKPDHVTAFEEVLGKLREALAKSVDPVRKQQASGWKVYKATEPYQNNVLYISIMEPAVKGADYNVFPILQEAFGDVAAREIFEKYRAAFGAGLSVLNLTPVAATGK